VGTLSAIFASRVIHKNIKGMTFERLHLYSLCEYVGIVVVSRAAEDDAQVVTKYLGTLNDWYAE